MALPSSLPRSGPIRIDCRGVSPSGAVRRVEAVLKTLRGGARLVIVEVEGPGAIEALTRWSAQGRAPHEVVHGPRGLQVRVYLLPGDFGAHPLTAWRPPLRTPDEADLALVP